jgi:hypothetical protein
MLPMRSPGRSSAALLAAAILTLVAGDPARSQNAPITFSVIADVPYGVSELPLLEQHVADHNLYSPAEFMVHLGDLLFGECLEERYVEVADVLSALAVPTFVVPGDNEWNDCDDPDLAWSYWSHHFLRFEQDACGAPSVEVQAVRPENFAFVKNGVLFAGINLVAGQVLDPVQWNLRLQQDADWVRHQLETKRAQVRAAVLLAQAGPEPNRSLFFDAFELAAATFGKPILFLHGDGHSWIQDRPFAAANALRVQVDRGTKPPVQVTVTLDAVNPFQLERDPFVGAPVDRSPCVEAGPDLTIDLLEEAVLDGRASDDRDPPGALSVAWSEVQGPGIVSFADPTAPATSVRFTDAGIYQLRLAADDGTATSTDDLTVEVLSDQPRLTIDDLFVTEGETAVFTVTLAAPNGGTVQVDYASQDGTAAAGEDYQSRSGRLSFSGSTTARPVRIPIVQDGVVESTEDFFVTLRDPTNATLFRDQGAGVILDDDTLHYPLTVQVVGPGSVSLDPPGGLYEDGTLVALEALPDSVETLFRGWGGDLAGLDNPASLGMGSPRAVTASFETVPGLGVNFRQAGVGSASASNLVSTSSAVSAVAGQLYLAAIATHPHVEVTNVSGLELEWSPVFSQCSGRNHTGVSVWKAQGTPPADGIVSAVLGGAPEGAVLAVSRHSGVIGTDPIGNLVAGNTNGVAGACTGGIDADRYAFPITTLDTGSTVWAAAAMRSRTHTPGSQYDERAEIAIGSAGNAASLALQDGRFGFPGTKLVDGRFTSEVDWAVVALEIRRSEQPAKTTALSVETRGRGQVSPPGGVYDAGSALVLTATADPGAEFAEWEGDLAGQDNPAALTMDADKAVKAIFTPEPSEALLLAAALVGVALVSRPARRRAQARGGRMID